VTEQKPSSLLERYQRLIEISRDLASTLELNTLLNRIVQAAADVSDAEAASILLYDESHRQLYFQAATNMETPLMQGLIVPVEGSIAGWIITERQPVILSDVEKDPRHFSHIAKPTGVKTTSLLGVPLINKEEVIGALEAINKCSGDFSEEDQEVLAALGAQAVVAIENARLFQQSDLISELVHELRTPLGSLNAVAHLLLRPEINEQQRVKMVETMNRETNRLSEMASAFLDLARLESGRTQFRVERVDLKTLLEECAIVVKSRAEEKTQRVQLELPQGLPAIKGDRDKLKQVILNLLSNAIKYTPAGGTIRIAAYATADEVVYQIIDTGVGIPPEGLDHVFEKFYRAPGTERTAQGTGLGLSICKRIVEAHDGRISVQSTLGAGATFTVCLPVRPGVKADC
jgi:signal transduction histidine kinase